MLNRSDIYNLIHYRMPEAEIREALLALLPESITAPLLADFVSVLAETLEPQAAALSAIEDAFDCSGTGGSGLPHFNTSTAAAFVLAAGGLRVAKFGNRAATSASGSFDMLLALGLPLSLEAERVPELIDCTGLVFLYAPQFYPALARVASVRRALKEKTIFNFIGPLLNPVRPARRLLGVPDAHVQGVIAEYLSCLPQLEAALVVRGESGLDEIDPGGVSALYFVSAGAVTARSWSPAVLHAVCSEGAELSPQDNAAIFSEIVQGSDASSPYHASVCLNAGAGFHIAGKSASLEEGAALAAELIAGGAVKEKLAQLRRVYAGLSC